MKRLVAPVNGTFRSVKWLSTTVTTKIPPKVGPRLKEQIAKNKNNKFLWPEIPTIPAKVLEGIGPKSEQKQQPDQTSENQNDKNEPPRDPHRQKKIILGLVGFGILFSTFPDQVILILKLIAWVTLVFGGIGIILIILFG